MKTNREARTPNSELRCAVTPFSTVGPFFKLLVRDRVEGTDCLVTETTRGTRITISGTLLDGRDTPVDDGLVEIWQAYSDGRYPSASIAGQFSGFGRAATGPDGRFEFQTIKPGAVPLTQEAGPGRMQAPHILVGVMARGIMSRCWTRMYFPDEPLNTSDPVLQLVPAERRDTLIARHLGGGVYEFNVVLQGVEETVFFDA